MSRRGRAVQAMRSFRALLAHPYSHLRSGQMRGAAWFTITRQVWF